MRTYGWSDEDGSAVITNGAWLIVLTEGHPARERYEFIERIDPDERHRTVLAGLRAIPRGAVPLVDLDSLRIAECPECESTGERGFWETCDLCQWSYPPLERFGGASFSRGLITMALRGLDGPATYRVAVVPVETMKALVIDGKGWRVVVMETLRDG